MALYLGSVTRLARFDRVGDVFVHRRPNKTFGNKFLGSCAPTMSGTVY